MSKTLTVRTDHALAEKPIEARAGHLKGRLMLREQTAEPWRESLRRRNWRS